jgi:hypothetical protein
MGFVLDNQRSYKKLGRMCPYLVVKVDYKSPSMWDEIIYLVEQKSLRLITNQLSSGTRLRISSSKVKKSIYTPLTSILRISNSLSLNC